MNRGRFLRAALAAVALPFVGKAAAAQPGVEGGSILWPQALPVGYALGDAQAGETVDVMLTPTLFVKGDVITSAMLNSMVRDMSEQALIVDRAFVREAMDLRPL